MPSIFSKRLSRKCQSVKVGVHVFNKKVIRNKMLRYLTIVRN